MRHIDDLREAVQVTKWERSFHIDAWVVLPDHMHTVWTLPLVGDDDFSNRWKSIKIRFVQKLPRTSDVQKSGSPRANEESGSDGSGSTRFAMITITGGTLITYIGIR